MILNNKIIALFTTSLFRFLLALLCLGVVSFCDFLYVYQMHVLTAKRTAMCYVLNKLVIAKHANKIQNILTINIHFIHLKVV